MVRGEYLALAAGIQVSIEETGEVNEETGEENGGREFAVSYQRPILPDHNSRFVASGMNFPELGMSGCAMRATMDHEIQWDLLSNPHHSVNIYTL